MKFTKENLPALLPVVSVLILVGMIFGPPLATILAYVLKPRETKSEDFQDSPKNDGV